nr:MAG: thymidylate synthase complementing protein [Bacteriophage sp.]
MIMLKISNFEVMGWEHAIRGMRNPMNSWAKSDSEVSICECEHWPHDVKKSFARLGSNDLDLMKRLRNAGTDHRKFMRMIVVYVDITAPLYWWKEFDTYKVGTVANSCSTMHKIAAKEFTLEDFSCEHLSEPSLKNLRSVIKCMNDYREEFLKDKDKHNWWQMIQLLPSSYNQKRTIMLNYEVLANIYKSRRNHKLDEWHIFCDWIEELPYSELITGYEEEDKL